MNAMVEKIHQHEEDKRRRMWSEADRWRVLQETIAWVDSQMPVHRNTAKACLEKERRLLFQIRAGN
jgi:hypothetical protein